LKRKQRSFFLWKTRAPVAEPAVSERVCVCVCVCECTRACAKRKRGRLSLCSSVLSIFESRARVCESDAFALAKKKFEYEISRVQKLQKNNTKERTLLLNSIIAIHTKLNHYIKLFYTNYASSTTFFYYYRLIISRYHQFSFGEEGVVQLLGDEFEPRLVHLRETSLPIGG